MSDSREVVLARARNALADNTEPPVIPRDYRTTLAPGTDVLSLFAARVSDYRATVIQSNRVGLAEALSAALATIGAKRVVVPPDLPDAWLATTLSATIVHDDPPLSVGALDQVDAVVTGCAVAIAETGTIVLDAGVAQGRRVITLLPDHHICVVDRNQIVGSVAEALPRLDPGHPLTWISGPSATSDIELERIEGVHGPRHLIVVVVGGG